MIDYLAIGVTHLLLLVALLRLLSRPDLDREEAPAASRVAPLTPAPDNAPASESAPPPQGAPPQGPPPHGGGVARLPRRPRGGGRA